MPLLSYKIRWKIRQPFETFATFIYHKMIDHRHPVSGWTIKKGKWNLDNQEVELNKFAYGVEEGLWSFICGDTPRFAFSIFMKTWRGKTDDK